MLNQSATEAQNSAEFLKTYLECVEELPIDVIKTKSLILELDIKSSNIINETEELTEKIISSNGEMKKKFTNRLLEVLIQLQDIKSEKLHYSQIILERVESKARAVQLDFKNDISINKTEESATTIKNTTMINQLLISQLPIKTASKPASSASSSASETNNINNNSSGNERGGGIKRLRRATRLDAEERAETPKPVKVENIPIIIKEKPSSSLQQTSTTASKKTPSTSSSSVVNLSNVSGNGNNSKKKIKKKKKALSSSSSKQSSNQSVQELISIEDENEDEETYCICEQVSYGEMILCENDACKIEWFHFSCVSLTTKPKGRWYCPSCRGDRPNVLNKTLRKKS